PAPPSLVHSSSSSCSPPTAVPPDPPSFPTRRSSDLPALGSQGLQGAGRRRAHAPRRGADPERRRRAGAEADEPQLPGADRDPVRDRKSTRLNSSHVKISYAVFCLKKKNAKTSRDPKA